MRCLPNTRAGLWAQVKGSASLRETVGMLKEEGFAFWLFQVWREAQMGWTQDISSAGWSQMTSEEQAREWISENTSLMQRIWLWEGWGSTFALYLHGKCLRKAGGSVCTCTLSWEGGEAATGVPHIASGWLSTCARLPSCSRFSNSVPDHVSVLQQAAVRHTRHSSEPWASPSPLNSRRAAGGGEAAPWRWWWLRTVFSSCSAC